MKSFYSSSHSLLSGGGSIASMRALTHSFTPSYAPIREKSTEMLTTTSSTAAAAAAATKDAEVEYLIRRQTIGELDSNDVAAVLEKFSEATATKVSDDADGTETTEFKFDHLKTIPQPATADEEKPTVESDTTPAVEDQAHRDGGSSASPEVVDAEAIEVRTSKFRDTRRTSIIKTLETYSVMDAMVKLEEEREEQKASKEGRPARAADNLTAKVTTFPTIPNADKLLPLSESSIRASDVVTADILERAIKNDLRQISPNCADSLCVLAAIIVSRVLDSACSRVIRENKLPPAATWTEKAQREAVLLVEDVLSSAMIYVSRGGDVDFARSAGAWTSTPTKATSKRVRDMMDDASLQALTAGGQSTSELLPQQPPELLWEEHDDQEEDEEDAGEVGLEAATYIEPSITVIESQRAESGMVTSPDQENVQETERALKAEKSDLLSLAQLSIIEHQSIARDFTTPSETLPPTADHSMLQTSLGDHAPESNEEHSTHAHHTVWQQLFSNRRRSSVVSNVMAMPDVDEVDDDHADVGSAETTAETTTNVPVWRQLFAYRQSDQDHDEQDDMEL